MSEGGVIVITLATGHAVHIDEQLAVVDDAAAEQAAEDWFLVYMSGMDSATLNVVDVFDVNIMSDVEATRFETKNEDKDGNYKVTLTSMLSMVPSGKMARASAVRLPMLLPLMS